MNIFFPGRRTNNKMDIIAFGKEAVNIAGYTLVGASVLATIYIFIIAMLHICENMLGFKGGNPKNTARFVLAGILSITTTYIFIINRA